MAHQLRLWILLAIFSVFTFPEQGSAMVEFNPQYDTIGRTFVQNYYQMFDHSATRGNLFALYHTNDSLLSYEGQSVQGAVKIGELFESLSFKKIEHIVTGTDMQPTFEGGVVILVTGKLKTDDDADQLFSETFILKPSSDGTYFCQHDIFRINHSNE